MPSRLNDQTLAVYRRSLERGHALAAVRLDRLAREAVRLERKLGAAAPQARGARERHERHATLVDALGKRLAAIREERG